MTGRVFLGVRPPLFRRRRNIRALAHHMLAEIGIGAADMLARAILC
jgi:hypothetical protein